MKKLIIATAILSSGIVFANEYTIKYRIDALSNVKIGIENPTDPENPIESWNEISPQTSAWVDNGNVYNCSNWLPTPSTITSNQTFSQSTSNCSIDQNRTVQRQEQNSVTSVIRPIGSPTTESQTITGRSASRNYTVNFSAWVSGEKTCGDWTPAPLDFPPYETFETSQSQTCNENRNRDRNESYVDNITSTVINLPTTQETEATPTTETRSIYEDFTCQYYNGEDKRLFVEYLDGSESFARMEDWDVNMPNPKFYTGTVYEYDSEAYVFYRGVLRASNTTYSGKAANLYEACFRYINW